MRKKGIRKYYFFKMLGSYLLVLFVVLTGAFSVFFYYLISAKTEELDASTTQNLDMASQSVDSLYEQTSQIGASLVSNRTINQYFSANSTTPEFDYEVFTYIKTLQNAYPFIHSILLYRSSTQQVLSSTHGYTLQEEERLKQELSDALSDRSYYRTMTLPSLQASPKKQDDVIGFFYYATFQSSRDAKNAVVILIKKDELEKMMPSLALTSVHTYLLVDHTGNIILSNRPDVSAGLPDSADLIREVLRQDADRFQSMVPGHKLKLFAACTSVLDWHLVLLSDTNDPLAGLQDILRLLIIFSVVLLFAGIGVSLLFTRHLYSPVRKLLRKTADQQLSVKTGGVMNEYDYIETYVSALTEKSKDLESFAETAAPYVNETLYKKMLDNSYSKREHKQILLLAHAERAKHRVVLVSIDAVPKPTEEANTQSYGMEYYAIQNILHELLSGEHLVTSFQYDTHLFVYILSGDTESRMEDIQAALHKAQKVFRSGFQQSFSAAIGCSVDYIELHLSMKHARRILNYRFLLGANTVLTEESIPAPITGGSGDRTADYTSKIIQSIGNEETFTKETTGYIAYLTHTEYSQCLFSLKSTLHDLKKKYERLFPKLFVCSSPYYILFHAPETLITLDRVRKMLLSLNHQMILEQYQIISTRNEQLVQDIKQYIKGHYANPDLNTEVIAKDLHFSAGYIRKLFKSLTGVGVSEYIMNTRLEEAKRLLISTNLTATVICERIGLYNNTYFSTLFKKRYGTTPISYRQMMLSNDMEEMHLHISES